MKKIKAVFCALFRHSRIVTTCFGYKYCARCGTQVGDSLAGIWDGKDAVLIGHNCETCHNNYNKMGFIDKFLVTNPFTKAEK
jgi:hypothetical protein